MSDDLELVKVNTTSDRYNMSEIERGIIVIKEGSRSVVSNISFTSLHKQLVTHMIYFMALWLNDFLDINIQ